MVQHGDERDVRRPYGIRGDRDKFITGIIEELAQTLVPYIPQQPGEHPYYLSMFHTWGWDHHHLSSYQLRVVRIGMFQELFDGHPFMGRSNDVDHFLNVP